MQAEVVHRDADRASARMLSRNMRRWGWFIAVGCAAAAVHWLVVVALVGTWGWRPLVANVPGWLVAFSVSFAGHHRLTFRGHGAPVVSSAWRFFVVSAGGFAINEAAYALLLGWSGQRYDLALAVVLIGVAGVTYLLSRHWAFLRIEGS
jgi:putative flippase GtrA